MEVVLVNRILISGTNSNCGKTTITMALLAAFQNRGLEIASFKSGPDYIDPMFHRKVFNVETHNLDPYFSTEQMLCDQFIRNCGKDLSIIEGAMGFYDGIGVEGRASAWEVAKSIKAPAVLIIDAKGMSNSAAAIIKGFKEFKEESMVEGVIFNGISPMLYPLLRDIVEKEGIKAYGFLPREEKYSIGSRNLGLITADEIEDIKEKINGLRELAEKYIDLDGLFELAKSAPVLEASDDFKELIQSSKTDYNEAKTRIAVSRDNAFCFMYKENIEILEDLGCEVVYFSPLEDEELPKDISGLYLCGGYPELYTEELSKNRKLCDEIKDIIERGIPTIAECGGFMYLHDSIEEIPMVGFIKGNCIKTDKLQRFGYIEIKALQDNLLCNEGDSIRVHEFHYYDSENCGEAFMAKKASNGLEYLCCHGSDSLYAGFPHIYLPANPDFAKSFVDNARKWKG